MKRTVCGLLLVIVSVVLSPREASAQAKTGDRELLFNGSVNTILVSDFTSTSGQGLLNVGQFLSDRLEVGGGPSLFIFGGAGDTTVQFGANGFVRRFFPSSNPQFAPFVGGEVYVQDFSEAGDTTFVNGVGGLKNYLSETTAIEMSGAFGFNPANPGDFKIIQFRVGMTYLF
jgi:hypothetical protein